MNISDLESLDAYELVKTEELSDIGGTGYLLRHKKSGARVAAILNDDENKVFYIGFRTPPADSTGVPHIIEHTVLCGSDKYPVKDPFVELVKGSLNTFLNAMTYPDKTVYPIASCNDADFRNLMDVYLDAVFHPNIYKHEEIFKQEGWHYELEDADAPIEINGVVYNEMKGAFSSAEDVLQREILNSLFPDTAYGVESGGDPERIPDLTYEAYLDFHRKYYHPCNSYIYLYGDIDLLERLKYMDEEYLCHYDEIEVDSAIPMQEPFDAPREVTTPYPIASTEDEEENAYLSYSAVVGDALDRRLYVAFEILDYALISAPGAPLKQALIDVGIGKDVYGGYDSGTLQPVFSIVAKGADASDKERFLSVIRETLEGLVRDGLNGKSLLAGISSEEFHFREADFGNLPKGLIYGLQCLDSWLYDDAKPFWHLQEIEIYRFMRESVGSGYFENLIKEYLLDNSHASVVIITPEKGLNAKREEELAAKLAAYKASLSEDEVRRLVDDTRHLKEYQEEPSPREDLDKIPMLKRDDISKETQPLYNRVAERGGITLVHHDMPSGGIDYITLMFDVRDLPIADLPYLTVLKEVLGYVDTESYGYAELANEVDIQTGGINCGAGIYMNLDAPDQMNVTFEVQAKVLSDKLPEAGRLLREILVTSKIGDEKRLSEILSEMKSRMQIALSSSGHVTAMMRATSYISKEAYYAEAMRGIDAYRLVSEYEEAFAGAGTSAGCGENDGSGADAAKEEASAGIQNASADGWAKAATDGVDANAVSRSEKSGTGKSDSAVTKRRELIEKLNELVHIIFNTDRLMASVTCAKEDADAVDEEVAALAGKLFGEDTQSHGQADLPESPCTQAKGSSGFSGKSFAAKLSESSSTKAESVASSGAGFPRRQLPTLTLEIKNEGFFDASQVQYVARTGNFARHGYEYNGALKILKTIMGYDYLWQKIRVQGGAYGCMNDYSMNGAAYFVSYRDPNLTATNEVYDGIPEYLDHFSADEKEMTKYIIGTISGMDTPLNPKAKGAKSMSAWMMGLSESDLQRERDEVLLATDADIRALKPLIESVLSDGALCVIGNEEALRREQGMFRTLEKLA